MTAKRNADVEGAHGKQKECGEEEKARTGEKSGIVYLL
jgi:hypothetical protein